eukprot:tig00001155_g7317.t1
MAPDPGGEELLAGDTISEPGPDGFDDQDAAPDDAQSLIFSEGGSRRGWPGRSLSRTSSFHSLLNDESEHGADVSFEELDAFERHRSFSEASASGCGSAFGRFERFMQRLSNEVLHVLSSAAGLFGEARAGQISALFDNLKQHVEPDVLEYLRADSCAPPLASAGAAGEGAPLYFELLAEHYNARPAEARRLHGEMEALWSNVHVPSVFALLSFRWLLEGRHQEEEGMVRRMNVFLKGTNRLFWYDLETSGRRFAALYEALRDAALAGCAERAAGPAGPAGGRGRAALRPFLAAMCVAEGADDCASSSGVSPPESRATSPVSDGAAGGSSSRRPSRLLAAASGRLGVGSAFVGESVRVLQLIRSERALLHYLNAFLELKGIDRSLATDIKLQMALYSFTMPGGPMYPTRDVRHCAAAVMDALYPDGRRSRRITAFAFRVLHPYYALPSILHWSKSALIGRLRRLRRPLAARYPLLSEAARGLSRAASGALAAPGRAARGARDLLTLPARLTFSFWRAALRSALALLPALPFGLSRRRDPGAPKAQ